LNFIQVVLGTKDLLLQKEWINIRRGSSW